MLPSAAHVKGAWAPPVAAAIGLVVAILAGLVSLRAGGSGAIIVQAQVVGIAYLAAGAIAWHRRPDNATGPLLVAIGYLWYFPDFQASAVPPVAALAFATRRLVNTLSAYLLLAFPSGRLGLRRHRIVMGLAIAIAAVQVPTRCCSRIESLPSSSMSIASPPPAATASIRFGLRPPQACSPGSSCGQGSCRWRPP